ncbi:hypothetical protein ACN3XK_43465 [Actinomadura welshii]
MGDTHRPVLPLARFLVVALGLLGFMAAPTTGSGAQSGASATGTTISAVRTWVVQHASTRSRASAKPRPGGHAQAAPLAGTAATAVTRHVAAPEAPDAGPVPAVLPPGTGIRPPPARAARAPAAPAASGLAVAGVPRGRAPPASTRV